MPRTFLFVVLIVCLIGIPLAYRLLHDTGGELLPLTRNGVTGHVIVTGADPIKAEQTAANELAHYLNQVTGAKFEIVSEAAFTGAGKKTPAIFVGWTDYAAAQGDIALADFGAEEWLLRRVGKNLIITGGRSRGTLYGVYDFLENQVGVHWLARDAEVVPSQPTLLVGPLDRRAKPAFRIRNNYPTRLDEGEMRFRVRNRQNFFAANVFDLPTPFFDAYGGREFIGGPYHCHNFSLYVPVDKYGAGHPEYYAQDKNGGRVLPLGQAPGGNKVDADFARAGITGGICLTNPEVRKIVLANLLERIAADRREFPPGRPASPDQPPPMIYDVSQQDNDVVCQCTACRAVVAREGSESGPLIEFINELADGVSVRYPEIKLQTFAYMWSQIPPKTLRPRDNVVIRWADWFSNHSPQPMPEPWHPLTAPVNAWREENLRQWSAITPAGLHVWDYGEPFAWPDFPFTLAPMLAEDIRLFADNHVFAVFLQSGGSLPWSQVEGGATVNALGQFSPLYNWLACQLMLDPRRPVEPLIDTFMAGYYGLAAPMMRALYDKLSAAQRTLPPRAVSGINIMQIDSVTPEFHAGIDELLQKAEAACEPGSPSLRRVQFDRLRSDSALLDNWQKLTWKLAPGSAMPFDRDEVIARIESRAEPVMTGLGHPPAKQKTAWVKSLTERLRLWRSTRISQINRGAAAELPEPFRSLPPDRVMQFLHPSLGEGVIVPDPEAAGAKAFRVRDTSATAHAAAPVFGLYDQMRKEQGPTLTIAKGDIPQDGKFHLYKVGRWRVLPGTRVWGHKLWLLNCLDVEYAYSPPGPEAKADANDWEVWVSAKFTGPAYIQGSQDKENGFFIDRVILVRPEAG